MSVFAQTKTPAMALIKPEVSAMWTANLPESEKAVLATAPANFYHFGAANFRQTSNTQRFSLEFAAPATLTRRVSTPDFKVEQESSCVQGRSYAAESNCVLVVHFTPQGAGRGLGKLSVTSSQSSQPVTMMLGG